MMICIMNKSIKKCVRNFNKKIIIINIFLEELNELFSRFKDDPDADFINVNRLTEVLQAFGRNPSLKDSEERIIELETAGKQPSMSFSKFCTRTDSVH